MRNRKKTACIGAMSVVLLACVFNFVVASPVSLPNTFVNGTVADANQVNANFSAVKSAVDDNDARIQANQVSLQNIANSLPAAGARVQVVRNPFPGPNSTTVQSSFNNLAAATPTVTNPNPGEFHVDFGASLQGRMFTVTPGISSGWTSPGPSLVGVRFGAFITYAWVDGATPNVVRVHVQDNMGNPVDSSFFVIVH